MRGQLLGLLVECVVKLTWDDRRKASALEIVVFIWYGEELPISPA